ncbi:MAG: hypothetical protein ACPGJV_08600 [Bacteriovoracaceae bacterium]
MLNQKTTILILALSGSLASQAFAKDSKFTSSASLEMRSGVSTEGGESRPFLSTLEYFGDYQLNKKVDFTLRAGVEKELSENREASINNTMIYNNIRKIIDTKYGHLDWKTNALIPTNEDSRKGSSLVTSITTGPLLKIKTPSPKFGVSVRTQLRRNFFEFKTSQSESVNTHYSLTHRVDFSYRITDSLSVSTLFLNSHHWNANSNRTPDTFTTVQSLNYSLDRTTSLSLGHEIADYTFKSDGVSSNISVFDRKSSTVYLSMFKSF